MNDHRKLEAFQLADQLVVGVYRATKNFPTSEQYGLTSQMRRCAVSVAANIVEGCGRRSRKDYVRFLDIAFASARELGYFIDLAPRLALIDDGDIEEVRVLQGRTAAALAALIRSLR